MPKGFRKDGTYAGKVFQKGNKYEFKKGDIKLIERAKFHNPMKNSEIARRVSETMKERYRTGIIPWNKGKKGLQIAWNKGNKGIFSEESRKRMSISARKRCQSPTWVNPMKGKHHTEEAKEKNRLAHLGKHHSDKTKLLMSSQRKGVPKSEEAKEKNRISQLLRFIGKKISEETKEKLRKKAIERCKNPEYLRKILIIRKPNKSELKLNQLLQVKFPNEFKFVGDGSFVLNRYNPDFLNVNGKKLIIELFGERWHEQEEEISRPKVFSKYGYRTLIIWEHELKNKQQLLEKINNFIMPVSAIISQKLSLTR